VEYDWHGQQKIAYAVKEVIVSAGTIMSPQILMLSGIGPKEHLEYFGVILFFNSPKFCTLILRFFAFQIKVKSDRPVGENLQDHVSIQHI
jgi:choline dehydrogenase-like flavoprotein